MSAHAGLMIAVLFWNDPGVELTVSESYGIRVAFVMSAIDGESGFEASPDLAGQRVVGSDSEKTGAIGLGDQVVGHDDIVVHKSIRSSDEAIIYVYISIDQWVGSGFRGDLYERAALKGHFVFV